MYHIYLSLLINRILYFTDRKIESRDITGSKMGSTYGERSSSTYIAYTTTLSETRDTRVRTQGQLGYYKRFQSALYRLHKCTHTHTQTKRSKQRVYGKLLFAVSLILRSDICSSIWSEYRLGSKDMSLFTYMYLYMRGKLVTELYAR